MRVFYGRKATKVGDWEHIGVELAVKVVLHLEDCNRKSAHQTSHVWRDAVRLATTRLAPKHLDTAQMKECFPNVSELELQSLDLSPRDMLCLGGLRRLATLRLLRCSLQDRAALLALAPLSTLGCLEMRVVQGAGAEILDELLKCLVGLTSLQLEIWLPVAKAPKLKHLSALTGLRQLAYKQGPVQTSLPGLTHLSSLASLEDLSLDGASLSNSLMGGLSGLTRLTRLSLRAALSLSNFGLEPLRELAAVRELDLSMPLAMFDDGSITDEGMSSLAGLQHLTRLRLSGRAGITAGGLGWLATCTQLEHLDLSLCRLGTGNPGSFLWTLRRLSFLSLRGTHVAATEFGGLCELKTLRELDLATTGFSDACCQHLAALTGLTKLDLSCCPITNQGLAAIAQQARAGPGAARASQLRRLLLQQCRCSMLGVAAALSAHKGVALWPPGRDHMPRFMNVANVLLVAQAGTGRYVLRARYAPEPRRTQAMLAWATVVVFFTIYLLSLLGMMVWVVLLPLLGCLTALVLLLASLAGVSVAPAQCRHLARRLEMVLLTVLVGLHGSAPAPHGDP